mmetsp:Transcript_23004/g.38065  ORF Transcript_23004/g.38065 Transcript_23004/m.38065 type:complete len:232 (-) Transcript_23004:1307-2002(-)
MTASIGARQMGQPFPAACRCLAQGRQQHVWPVSPCTKVATAGDSQQIEHNPSVPLIKFSGFVASTEVSTGSGEAARPSGFVASAEVSTGSDEVARPSRRRRWAFFFASLSLSLSLARRAPCRTASVALAEWSAIASLSASRSRSSTAARKQASAVAITAFSGIASDPPPPPMSCSTPPPPKSPPPPLRVHVSKLAGSDGRSQGSRLAGSTCTALLSLSSATVYLPLAPMAP